MLACELAELAAFLFFLQRQSRKCSGYQLLQNKPPQICGLKWHFTAIAHGFVGWLGSSGGSQLGSLLWFSVSSWSRSNLKAQLGWMSWWLSRWMSCWPIDAGGLLRLPLALYCSAYTLLLHVACPSHIWQLGSKSSCSKRCGWTLWGFLWPSLLICYLLFIG